MEELIKLVEEWSKNKGLDKSDPTKQALKFFEEAGEVASGLARSDMSAIEDGIGDTIVTLIILSQQLGLTLEQCLQTAYDEIKGRNGKMVNGVFVKSSDLKPKLIIYKGGKKSLENLYGFKVGEKYLVKEYSDSHIFVANGFSIFENEFKFFEIIY